MSTSDPNSSWKATASWKNLRARADVLRRARAFFYDRDFCEVETPLLLSEVVVEAHIDPVAVTLGGDKQQAAASNNAQPMWLQASPEAGMKRLLATAATSSENADDNDAPTAIYQIGRAFREAESGTHHNVEFTLAEWYALGHDMQAGMGLLDELFQTLLDGFLPTGRLTGPAERISYREAFLRHAEIDPLTASAAELAGMAAASGVAAPAEMGDDRDAWLDLLLTDLVAPRFATDRATILYDYPASQAALARVGEPEGQEGTAEAGSTPVAKRFELFYGPLELANGYWELLDADILRQRTDEANAIRKADGRDELPAPEKLLTAMEHGLPACSGCALGIDRVVMLATGAESIEEVIALPTTRA